MSPTPHAQPAGLDVALSAAGITGLSSAVARKLTSKGIRTVRDLLEQAPRRYVDLSRTVPIRDLKIGEEATVLGTIRGVDSRYLPVRRKAGPQQKRKGPPLRGKHMLVARIGDGTGFVEAVWWNQPFRAKQLQTGATVAVAGRFEKRQGKLQVSGNFFVERLPNADEAEDPLTRGVHTGRIIPVHPATEGVSPAMLRRYVHSALRRYGATLADPLPDDVIERVELMQRRRAFEQIHFPSTMGERVAARKRLAFEELFVLSAGLAVRKRRIAHETAGIAHSQGGAEVERFLAALPFSPTGAQRRAIEEILQDMARPIPMNRLLQGEVGSGKTVVAIAAAVAAAANGSQTALMAPTEVLAEQHYLSITRMLSGVGGLAPAAPGQLSFESPGLQVTLLTGSTTGKDRERALEAASSGASHLVIGTHALIQEGVEFHRLGCAVIDEQHRFGVHQRISLREKGGTTPDVLIMTATPIPRTLAMTLYGDLDVSVLDELPPGRQPIETIVMGPERRSDAEEIIRSEVAAGRQAFVVCPLVEQSTSLEAKAAESEYERIRVDVFPDARVGLIHGRLRPTEKERVMDAMRAGEIDVLVATTVIEVGVDFPNATVMMVEDADRFGLSQLHQLRGRIGRGEHPSTCILLTGLDLSSDEEERERAVRRLEAMRKTSDGFLLAERDLEIRGEGQIFGRGKVDTDAPEGAPAQAGVSDLRFASLIRDGNLLSDARKEAFALVESDPVLAKHPLVLAEVRRRFADRLDWLFAG